MLGGMSSRRVYTKYILFKKTIVRAVLITPPPYGLNFSFIVADKFLGYPPPLSNHPARLPLQKKYKLFTSINKHFNIVDYLTIK